MIAMLGNWYKFSSWQFTTNAVSIKDKTIFLFIFLIALLPIPCLGEPARQDNSHSVNPLDPINGLTALHEKIRSITSSPQLSTTTIGIAVLDLESGQILFEQNAERLFHPASTMKLFTTAAALSYLGSSHAFTTSIAILPNTIKESTVDGDIWLIGSGDPTLQFTDLQTLAGQVRSQGITEISGDIICDDTAFDTRRYGKGWMWDDQPYKDFAPIGALVVNRNTIKIFVSPGIEPNTPARIRLEPATNFLRIINVSNTTNTISPPATNKGLTVLRRWQTQENSIDITGTISRNSKEQEYIRNVVFPARYTGTLFSQTLSEHGILLRGSITTGKVHPKALVVAEHRSEPLSGLIIGMNKDSQNLDAEILLKAVGQKITGEQGSDENGIKGITELLSRNGINLEATRFADGSGVSRYNLVSPAVLATLLQSVYNSPHIRNEFIASLPVAGVDGNLIDRMKNSTATKIVKAKTGAMTGVSSLAGYAQSLGGKPIAFAIMMEHFIGSHSPFLVAQDQICDTLCRFSLK